MSILLVLAPRLLSSPATRRFTLLFAMVASIFFSGHAQSQVQRFCTGATCTTSIYFYNGVFNTRGNARASANALADGVASRLTADQLSNTEFGLSYNRHLSVPLLNGHGLDLLESLSQTIQVTVADIFGWLSDADSVPVSIRAAFATAAGGISLGDVTFDPGLQAEVATYKRKIGLERKRVILVAHSQGNLFANTAYNLLSPQERATFAIVSVATPTGPVAGGERSFTPAPDDYISSANDQITLVPRLAGVALEANIVNGRTEDWTGHEFVRSYLTAPSRGQILDLIGALFAGLPFPGPLPPPPVDTDGDGIPNSVDQCPTVFGNGPNGCPVSLPLDSDGDGLPDSADACPQVAASTANGCPVSIPLDTDGDGIPDSSDSCPAVAANTANGCPAIPPPPVDSDGDGTPDSTDACPTVAASTPNGCPPTPQPLSGILYSVVDLTPTLESSSLPCIRYGQPYKINNNGVIVGTVGVPCVTTFQASYYGYTWATNTGVPTYFCARAVDINDDGTVLSTTATISAMWPQTGPGSGCYSPYFSYFQGDSRFIEATAISATGRSIGNERVLGSVFGMSFDNGVTTPLGSIGGSTYTEALAINDSGVIVGAAVDNACTASDYSNCRFAVSLQNSVWLDLRTTLGRVQSSAIAINSAGQILVQVFPDVSQGSSRSGARLIGGNAVSEIPGVTSDYVTPLALNDFGVVLATESQTGDSAILYYSGQSTALSALIDPMIGIRIERANDINERGQILAIGRTATNAVRFLLLNPNPSNPLPRIP